MRKGMKSSQPVPEFQASAFYNDNPSDGVKVTVLDTTPNCRIIGTAINITWSGAVTNIKVTLTVDGVPIIYTKTSPASTTYYFIQRQHQMAEASQELHGTNYVMYAPFQLEGRSVKVEAEFNGGTVSNMKCRVWYAKW